MVPPPGSPSAASGMLVQSLYALTEYKLERARTPRLIMHQDPNQAIQTVLTETRLCRPEPLDTTTPHISSYGDAVPAFLKTMHAELVGLESTGADGRGTVPAAPEFAPATTARKSLSSPDHIISMIDGKPYRSLGRHIAAHGLTPDSYRARYNLKSDYPMVAPGSTPQITTYASGC